MPHLKPFYWFFYQLLFITMFLAFLVKHYFVVKHTINYNKTFAKKQVTAIKIIN